MLHQLHARICLSHHFFAFFFTLRVVSSSFSGSTCFSLASTMSDNTVSVSRSLYSPVSSSNPYFVELAVSKRVITYQYRTRSMRTSLTRLSFLSQGVRLWMFRIASWFFTTTRLVSIGHGRGLRMLPRVSFGPGYKATSMLGWPWRGVFRGGCPRRRATICARTQGQVGSRGHHGRIEKSGDRPGKIANTHLHFLIIQFCFQLFGFPYFSRCLDKIILNNEIAFISNGKHACLGTHIP